MAVHDSQRTPHDGAPAGPSPLGEPAPRERSEVRPDARAERSAAATSRPFAVKEIYFTHQGEGAHTGRAAVFCRFSGCNLWSGREDDRGAARCDFCDTDFVGTDGPGGGTFASADALADAIREVWSRGAAADRAATAAPFVVFTGGEPGLQLRGELVDACHQRGLEIAVETNGTVPVPAGIDWVTVSPKAGTSLAITRGQELKLVWPQPLDPASFESLAFDCFFLQPMDGPDYDRNLALTFDYCRAHPRWQPSIQTHKYLGIP